MKAFKYKYWLLILAGLLFILFTIKAFRFFTAKPVVTVDYVTQLNKKSRPESDDPKENAVWYYQKAFDEFFEIPYELQKLKQRYDFDAHEKLILEEWLSSNTTALEYFREAASKSYCWMERISNDNSMSGIEFFELKPYRDLIDALVWNSRVNAANGKYKTAFKNLLSCYRSANHKCDPKQPLAVQYYGLHIKSIIIEDAFRIIDAYEIENDALEYLQFTLRTYLDNNLFVPSFQTERLFAYDALQRTFIDNGKGTGRMAWSIKYPKNLLASDNSALMKKYKEFKQRQYFCLSGPTRTDIANQIDTLIDLSERVMSKTPWQIKNENNEDFDKIQSIKSSHVFFMISPITVDLGIIHNAYYETKAQTEALITLCAIMRYKNNTNRFPQSLAVLVANDYLHSIPNDPYSDGSVIYILTDNDFKLYSVGENYIDNRGVIQVNDSMLPNGEFDETLTNSHTSSLDIIYWPIKPVK